MADEPTQAPTARARDWLTTLQLALTVFSAGLGIYVTFQQQAIKQQQDRLALDQAAIRTKQDELELRTKTKAQTELFADQAMRYIDEKLNLEKGDARNAIIIDLLDAIALANASAQGQTDRQKLLHMPLLLALATGNADALGLIGNAGERRAVWLALANSSGEARVRITAMKAVARSAASRPVESLLELFELSEHLNNPEILDASLGSIVRVVDLMERYPDPGVFRDDDRLKPLVARLEKLQTGLVSQAVTPAQVPAVPSAGAAPTTNPSASLQQQSRSVERALAFLRDVDNMGPPIVKVGATPTQPSVELPGLVADLTATISTARRESRQRLAQLVSPELTGQLLDKLGKEGGDYRVRVGVASVLFTTKQSVVITSPEQTERLVSLLGDDDFLVRKYAAETLMKLKDKDTVGRVHEALSRVIRDRDRPGVSANAVYNAIVVLGTWLRTRPEGIDPVALETELRTLLPRLRQDKRWRNSANLLEQLLAAKAG